MSSVGSQSARSWLAENGPKELEFLLRAVIYHPSDPISITDDGTVADTAYAPYLLDIEGRVAACVVADPDAVKPHLAQVRRYLEKYESRLGVRAAWLAWVGRSRRRTAAV